MVDVLRSVELDKWTEKQTTSMRLGGNRRLDEYLKEHDHSSLSSDLQQKYDNTVAEDYRFMLATEVAQALGYRSPVQLSGASCAGPFLTPPFHAAFHHPRRSYRESA